MSTRSPLIDRLINKAQNRIFLDVGQASLNAPGWQALDLRPDATFRRHPLDLPWPIADETVFYIRCMDFMHTIPHACPEHPKDPLIELCEEFWRVLLPGGQIWLSMPYAPTQKAWANPATRRTLTYETLELLSCSERVRRGLPEDYTSCDFEVTHGFTFNEEGSITELHVELFKPE